MPLTFKTSWTPRELSTKFGRNRRPEFARAGTFAPSSGPINGMGDVYVDRGNPEVAASGKCVQRGSGIFGGRPRYAGIFENNFAIPQYAVDEELGPDSLQGIEVEDLLARYGRVSASYLLAEASKMPGSKRLAWITDVLNQVRPGAANSMDNIRRTLVAQGTPAGEALARAIDATLQGHAVHKVMSGVDGLSGVFDDIGRFLGGAAGTVENTLADMICSPQALTLLPASLAQRGADPSTARQRLVELQRSCTERHDVSASSSTANMVVWGVAGVAALGLGYLIWRAM